MTVNDKYIEITFKFILGILKGNEPQATATSKQYREGSKAALYRAAFTPLTNAVYRYSRRFN